jgi:hypothetical protein
MTIIDSQAKRDHEFESAFLQQGVRCEPDFRGAITRPGLRPDDDQACELCR